MVITCPLHISGKIAAVQLSHHSQKIFTCLVFACQTARGKIGRLRNDLKKVSPKLGIIQMLWNKYVIGAFQMISLNQDSYL